MERILAGVDGSQASQGALEWAADLAARAGAELVAARVFVPVQAELPPDRDADLHDQQQRELEDWCAGLPGDRVRCVLLDGDPADALLAAARDERADLLVVGGRGSGGFIHLHLGSVAHHLAHHTSLALAIVPAGGARPVARLVVGVDGSPGSLAAVRFCAALAGRLSVPVTAVYAFEPVAEWVPESDPHSWRHQAEADVRTWVAPVERAGVPLDIDVDRDIHPVAAIARALDTRSGSAAVIGTRGKGGFTDLRLGRVPLQLVHHTGDAVVIVPPDTAD